MAEMAEHKFDPGQRVMTMDGIPGVVQPVHEGSPGQSEDDYEVTLDNGLGGGTYSAHQLSALRSTAEQVTAIGLHEAVEDYPEVGTLLRDHPDPATLSFAAALRRQAVDEEPQGLPRDTTQPDACAYCGGTDFENLTDNGRVRQATCATCKGTMSAHPGAQWTAELVGDPSNHPRPTVDPASGASPAGGIPGVTEFLDFDSRIIASRTEQCPGLRASEAGSGAYRHSVARIVNGDLPEGVTFRFAPASDQHMYHRLEMHHLGQEIGDLHWDPGNGLISGVNVHPDYRRRGVASHLYAKAYKLADERGESGPDRSGFQTSAGAAFRSAFDARERPDVSHIPTTVTYGPGEDDTDLYEHLIKHHYPASAEMVREWSPEQAREIHDNVTRNDSSCGWGRKNHHTAATDGPDWCTWRRQARCTYPGDITESGKVLGIPQDRGPCPWSTRWQQQVCLAGETEYLTYNGYKTLKETVGTVQKVLTSTGQWVDAEIRDFGTQQLYAVTMRRNKQTKTIYATAGHRWFLQPRARDRLPGTGGKTQIEQVTFDSRDQRPWVAREPMKRHALSEVDADHRRATCSECGPVSINKAGPDRWMCREAKRQCHARQRERTRLGVTTRRFGLKAGDRLQWVIPRTSLDRWYPNPTGVAHGVVFGDGARESNDESLRGNGCKITLFGAKDEQLLRYFAGCPTKRMDVTDNPNRHVGGVEVTGLPGFFKDRPNLHESAEYLYGWLAGYFAADGWVSELGTPVLECASREVLEFVVAVCNRLTIGVADIRSRIRRGCTGAGFLHDRNMARFGRCALDKERPLHRLSLIGRTVRPELFLIEEHRRRFEGHQADPGRLSWEVVSVEETQRHEQVYCAVVPGTASFALTGNILTGNCPISEPGPMALMQRKGSAPLPDQVGSRARLIAALEAKVGKYPRELRHSELDKFSPGYTGYGENPDLDEARFRYEPHYSMRSLRDNVDALSPDEVYDRDTEWAGGHHSDAFMDRGQLHDLYHTLKTSPHLVPPLIIQEGSEGSSILDGTHRASFLLHMNRPLFHAYVHRSKGGD